MRKACSQFTRAQYFNATVEFFIRCFVYAKLHNLHTHTYYVFYAYSLKPFYNVKIVIALSTQLVRFLRGTSLSEVVFASKSSFYPAIHWDLSERFRNFPSLVFSPNTFPRNVHLREKKIHCVYVYGLNQN